jgi:hypothetical protein
MMKKKRDFVEKRFFLTETERIFVKFKIEAESEIEIEKKKKDISRFFFFHGIENEKKS